LELLVEKLDREKAELALREEWEFEVWTDLILFIGREKGAKEIRRIIEEGVKDAKHRENIKGFVDDACTTWDFK
jgi:hypothetical protein